MTASRVPEEEENNQVIKVWAPSIHDLLTDMNKNQREDGGSEETQNWIEDRMQESSFFCLILLESVCMSGSRRLTTISLHWQ